MGLFVFGGIKMFEDFLPIRLYTPEMLRRAKVKIAAQSIPFSFSKGFSCFSCCWENICKNSFPCFVFAYTAYAPRHFLSALSKLGYKSLALESIQKKRQLRITFDNKKSFTFSVSLIISSTECIHIAQQLILRWNLSKLPKDSCAKESLQRYYFLPKF